MPDEDALPCDFAGFKISGGQGKWFYCGPEPVLQNLEHLQPTTTFPDFRSMRMKQCWLGNSLADCAVEISLLSQVKDPIFQEHHP